MKTEPFYLYVFLFAIILGFGYWLARLGKPYNVPIQTVHKLVSVGAFIYLIFYAFQLNKVEPLGVGSVFALIVSSLFFVSMIATGGMLATEKEFPSVVLLTHKIVPYLTAASTGISLYLLSR